MRRIAMLALAMTMAGCSVDSTSPNGSVSGTYDLRRINGDLLPYTFPGGATLFDDQLTLYRDGSYVDESRYDSGTSVSDEGYYTSYNGSVTFQSTRNNVTYQGSLSDDVLTVITNGYTQVFERR
jgi:hypothetical protein